MTDCTRAHAQGATGHDPNYSWTIDYGTDLLEDINQTIHRGGTSALIQDCLKRCYREITKLRGAADCAKAGRQLDALDAASALTPAASESAANDINQPLMDLEIFIGEVDGAEAAQEGTIDGTEAIAALAKVREQTAWLEAQASGCASIMRDLRAFHVACGAPVPKVPQFPSEDRINLRLDILDEEHRELHDAVRDRDLVEVADALADIIYVTAGMALEFGVPLERVWNEVHRSNMAKVDPVTGKVRRRDDGKVLKPEGWTPPDIMAALTPLTEPCPYCDAEMVVTAPSCEACGREHPDRFTVTCTCRGNNDCDGSCQCPPDRPAHTSTDGAPK